MKADCYEVGNNNYVFQTMVTLSKSVDGETLVFYVFPFANNGKMLFFNQSEYKSTWQTLNYKYDGDGWIISTLLGDNEKDRLYVGFFQKNENREIYFFKKPYEDADPVYDKYYLKLSNSDFKSLLYNIVNTKYFRVLESKGDF